MAARTTARSPSCSPCTTRPSSRSSWVVPPPRRWFCWWRSSSSTSFSCGCCAAGTRRSDAMSVSTLAPRRAVRRHGSPVERAARGAAYHAVSAILAIAFLFPLLWAALNSVKPTEEANQQPPTWFPHSFSLENYRNLTSFDQGIWLYLQNSIIVSALTVAGSVVVCVLGG